MSVDLNDPKMVGYVPLDEIIEDEGGVAAGKVAEDIQLSTATIVFPNTGQTYESPSQAIVITNVGYDTVTIYGTHVEGEFELKSTVPGSLLAGETASVLVSFKPLTVGAKTGSIYFDTGNAAGDELVTLQGTGIISAPEVPPEDLQDFVEQTVEAYGNGRWALETDLQATNTALTAEIQAVETAAVLNADASTDGMGFVVDEDDMVSDSATKIPTQQSVKAFVDGIFSILWRPIVGLATYAEAWILLKLNGSLPTRALIKALVPQVGMSVFLTEDGRSGQFAWKVGDFTARISADAGEGLYLKADSVAANAGAWVRQYSGVPDITWWGLPTGVNDSAAIQAVVNLLSGGALRLPVTTAAYNLNVDVVSPTNGLTLLVDPKVVFSGAGRMWRSAANLYHDYVGTFYRGHVTGGVAGRGYSAFSTDLTGDATFLGNGVSAFFATNTPLNSPGFWWAINPILVLNAGLTGNGIACEVDLDNYAGNGKGQGITVSGVGTFNPQVGISIQYGGPTTYWQKGLSITQSLIGAAISGGGVTGATNGLIVEDYLENSIKIRPRTGNVGVAWAAYVAKSDDTAVNWGVTNRGGVQIGPSGKEIKRVLSATTSFNVGLIAAQTSFDFTFAMANVAIGDEIVVSPTGVPTVGICWNGYCNSAGNVTVRLTNVTAGNLDPDGGSGLTWRVSAYQYSTD